MGAVSQTKSGSTRLLSIGGIILFGWMLVFSAANARKFFDSDWSAALMLAAAAIAVLAIAFVVCRYMGKTFFLGTMLAITVGLRLAWVLAVDTPPISDFLDMHTAALSAARGDYSFGMNEYFTRWVYQLGFTFYEALAIKLFGTPIVILKLFNILFQAGTAVIIYRSASAAFHASCGRIAALMYAVYVPNIMMCSVLTNQHISVFFYFLGIYALIRNGFRGKYDWLPAGLCFGIGNLMRPLGSFFIAGFLAYILLFKLVPYFRERRWPALAARTVGLLVVYAAIQQSASFALIQAGVTSYPLSSQEPYWKFMVGLNPHTNGGWSYDDDVYVLQFPLGEERNRAELEVVKERMEDKRQLLTLLVSKAKEMWGGADSAPLWSLTGQNRPELEKKLIQIERIQYVLLALFGLAAMSVMAFRGGTAEASLFLTLLLGYAAIHIVIEVQTRYRFDIFPAVFVLQSFGFYAMLGAFKRRPGRAYKDPMP